MSFGFGVGDFIAVDAPDEFREIAFELSSIHIAISDLSQQSQNPESLLNRRGSDRRPEWLQIRSNLEETLDQLRSLVKTYHNMGKKAWRRVQFAGENLGELRGKLNFHLNVINMFVGSLTLSALGRMEPVLGQIEVLLRESLREERGGYKAQTIVSAHETNDPVSWEQIERDLILEGIGKEDFDKNKVRIKELLNWVVNNEADLRELQEVDADDSVSQQGYADSLEEGKETHGDSSSGSLSPGTSERGAREGMANRNPVSSTSRLPSSKTSSVLVEHSDEDRERMHRLSESKRLAKLVHIEAPDYEAADRDLGSSRRHASKRPSRAIKPSHHRVARDKDTPTGKRTIFATLRGHMMRITGESDAGNHSMKPSNQRRDNVGQDRSTRRRRKYIDGQSQFAALEAVDPNWRERWGDDLKQMGITDDLIRDHQDFVADFIKQEQAAQVVAPRPNSFENQRDKISRGPPPPPTPRLKSVENRRDNASRGPPPPLPPLASPPNSFENQRDKKFRVPPPFPATRPPPLPPPASRSKVLPRIRAPQVIASHEDHVGRANEEE
ncbi:uncharacterized protein BP5553_06613 [Venustampulla echinocandica]|uniref:Uncharacterized protein n=1 Tax=Venustampulla echinocandica TaxID=2656787 RepID=A0A370TKF0_9HELO|nr:uncharacterized protein BP5553_06613 [Venustampulla echinocandica]RDL36001.1 hypothetical protein BP5553_06613 [Venustampulla echinocandica]